MKPKNTLYCKDCAKRILPEWKGWPHKQAVPILPVMIEGACPVCGGDSCLTADRITWFNYHGENNTGLPDYWLLEIDGDRKKWGHPYYGVCTCAQCGTPAVLSEMRFPNGTQEFKCNCSKCGMVCSLN